MRKKPNTKGRKPRSKSWEDRESRDERRDSRRALTKSDEQRATNAPQWYATDPALLRDSSSIPFSWPLGLPINGHYYLKDSESITVPGIMAMGLVPTFGPSYDGASDPLNVAAASMYSFIRHANAGHANYDPNDFMLFVMGMTQIYSSVNYLERLYALATMYEQRNRYMPDALIRVQGVDPVSIRTNLADFRYGINVLINKISSIAVPATMSIFLRQAMLYAYVYSEGESVKDQLYEYYPLGFYKFGLDDDSAGQLVFTPLRTDNSLLTYQDLLDYVNELFDAIWEQEDFGIMSGDVIKAYGGNILSLSSLDEFTPIVPVYDPVVLHQMKNADIVRISTDNLSVKQSADKSYLQHGVYLDWASLTTEADRQAVTNAVYRDKILTLNAIDPSPELVIEATRLMVAYDQITDSYALCAPGSEVVRECKIVVGVGDNYSENVVSNNAVSTANLSSPEQAAFYLQSLANYCVFKFRPRLTVGFANSDGSQLIKYYDVLDVDNYAVLNSQDISKQHMAAMLNMLNVPSIAKNSTTK